MISYDGYLNRIQKVARAKNFVHKFRFLFIGIFSLIVAATAGLLIAKGTVTTAMSLPAQVYFGEEYAPTPASAFLSSVSYEYSLEGSGEWSTVKPVKVGKYLARTVTQKTVGYAYGNPVHFEILPLDVEFNITSDSVIYGDTPDCNIVNPVTGRVIVQNIVREELEFKYGSYTEANTFVSVVPESVKIVDNGGEDFTSCFNITFNGKNLDIIPRKITLQADNVVATYSDTAVEIADEVSENSLLQLANGDILIVKNGVTDANGTEIPFPKNKGNYKIGINSVEIIHRTDGGSVDVTHQYDITRLSAELIINARDITVTTGSSEKIYDGTALQNATRSFGPGQLVNGHEIFELSEYPSRTDFGEQQNINSFVIYDGDGLNVSENYNINVVYGTLKILKREITVQTGSAEKVYDGKELSNGNYEIISGLKIAAGHTVKVQSYGIINVWESGYNKLALTVYDQADNVVTHNYTINYEYGALTVLKRAITVKTGSAEGIYDGKKLYNHDYEITSENKIVENQTCYVANDYGIYNVNESGDNALQLFISDGINGDISQSNYGITYEYGALILNKRAIVVTTYTPSAFMYDGAYHFNTGYETRYNGTEFTDGLVNGDSLVVSNPAQIKDVGKIENKFDIYDISGNYEISVIYGELEVTARPITVKTVSDEKIYDGTPLINSAISRTYLSGNESAFGLADGDDVLELVGTPAQITEAGFVANECEYRVLNGNYTITEVIPGTLTVHKRALEIALSDITLKYGEIINYPYASDYKSAQGLVNGERIELFVRFVGVVEGEINPARAYTITLDWVNTKIYNKDGGDSFGNYNVTYAEATLLIENRLIVVTTGSAQKEYDGVPLSTEEYEASGTLADGQYVKINFMREITDVDESYEGNNDTTIAIYDENGDDVTGNYDLEYHLGTLTVTPRQLFVITESQSWVYDSEEHSAYEHYGVAHLDGGSGLINGDRLILISYATIVDAGEKENICEFEVPNSNYIILEEYNVYGTLKITAREIIVYTDSAEKVYDKTPLTCDTYTTKYRYSNEEGLLNGDKLVVTGALASITDVGDGNGIENRYDFEVPNSNYVIYGRGFGRLKITQREIVVVTDSAQKEYDGTPLTCTTYTTYLYGDKNQAGLIEGDGELTLIGAPASVTGVGDGKGIENICLFQVPGNNYKIADYEYGTLTVVQKAIKVEVGKVENVNYGETLVYPAGKGNFQNAETCGLANGEEMEIGVYYIYLQTMEKVVPKNMGGYHVMFDMQTSKVFDSEGNVIENGLNNYSITDFPSSATIRPKSISLTIKDAVITYGEGEDFIPEYSVDITSEDMPYGETVIPGFIYSNHGFAAELKHAGVYDIILDRKECTVYDVDGEIIEDGIRNYSLVFISSATVTINPRPITVELLDLKEIVYGEDHSYPEYEGNYKNSPDLVYGDTLEVSVVLPEGIFGVGVYAILDWCEPQALINGSTDFSDYEINFIGGVLEIIKRAIIVRSNDATKVYDGTPLSDYGYTTYYWSDKNKAGLLGDDCVYHMGTVPYIIDVGTLKNAIYYWTNNANYSILEIECGTLEVTPRKIAIITASDEWEYDGQYHSVDAVNEDESYYYNEETGEREPALVLDHRFGIVALSEIKDVGSIPNMISDESGIYDGEGNSVIGNYEIDVEKLGTLTVTPRHIGVQTGEDHKVYDGTPLTCEGYSTFYNEGEKTQKGLIEGDELILAGEPVFVTYAWEGYVQNANVYASPVGIYGNPNYEIDRYIYGTIFIDVREITVVIGDKVEEFTNAFYNFGKEVDNYENYLDCNLAEGEKLHIEVIFTYEDGSIITDPDHTRCNVGIYRMLLNTNYCSIYRDGERLFRGIENYAITCDGATYTVTPRRATITQNDIQAVYGDEIVYNGYQGGVNLMHYWGVQDELTFDFGYYYRDGNGELTLLPEKIRVGEYIIHVDEESVLVNGELPTNYDFTFVDGTLTVTQRAVTITLKDNSVIYGDEIVYPDGAYSFVPVVLPYGDTLQVFVKELEGKLNAGSYALVADEERTLVNGEDDLSDYIFSYVDGRLTVEKREIGFIFLTPPKDLVYGGEVYQYPAYIGNYLGEPDLAYSEQLEAVVLYRLHEDRSRIVSAPIDAGYYYLVLSGVKIYDEYGNFIYDGADNYACEVLEILFNVAPKDLFVTIHDSEYIYGFEAPEIEYTVEGLVYDDVYTVEFCYTCADMSYTKVEDAGVYGIIAGEQYINGNNNIGNYSIHINSDAVLTIHARKIVIETATSSREYDGTPYSDTILYSYYYDGEEDSINYNLPGFVNGYLPEIESIPTVTHVSEGKVENRLVLNVSSNYDVVYEIAGLIYITQRDLEVVVSSYEIIYGEDLPATIEHTVFNLVEGEKILISADILADSALPDVGTYEIKVNEGATFFEAGESTDYSISYTSGWLTVNVRRVSIASGSYTWEYDGTEHEYPYENPEESYYTNVQGEAVRPALFEGHAFVAGDFPKIKNVGSVPNICYSGAVVDSEGNLIKAGNYEIAIESSGWITVTARGIEVTTGDAQKEYDGKKLFTEEVEITSGEIVEWHRYILTSVYSITNADQTAEGNNATKIAIYDGTENVTSNYFVTYKNGTLTVTSRKIIVKTADGEWVYDGSSHSKSTDYQTYYYNNPEEEGLLPGDTLLRVTNTAITNVGSIKNTCTYRSAGNNYNIVDLIPGTLTITQRHITVVISSTSKYYDGEPLSNSGYRTYLTANPGLSGLVGADRLTVDTDSLIYITNVWESCENVYNFTLESDNYYIDEVINGYLEITPRPLRIDTATDSKYYDGTPLENWGYTTSLYTVDGGAGLIGDDVLTVLSWSSITDAGSIENACSYALPESGNYYLATISYGTLTVNKARLEIVLNEVESVQYGQTLVYPTENGTFKSAEGLIDGETLEYISVIFTDVYGAKTTPKNAGWYKVCIDEEGCFVTGSEKGILNYELIYDEQLVEIARLTLQISLTQSVEYTYDGTAHGYDGSAFTFEGQTAYGETLQIAVTYYDEDGNALSMAPSNAGNYKIGLDINNCIIKETSIMAVNNYVLECDDMLDYIINPASFYVVLEDVDGIIYDGTEFNYKNSGGFNYYGLFGTDSVLCNVVYYLNGEIATPVNAGVYTIEFDTSDIIFESGNESNYVFDSERGQHASQLTIVPRSVLITVLDRETEYTVEINPEDEDFEAQHMWGGSPAYGEAFVGDDRQNAGAKFMYKDSNGVLLEGVPEGVGIYFITVEFENIEVISNYDITVVDGTLTITGRRVLVTPKYTGFGIVYNGTAIKAEAPEFSIEHVHNIEDARDGDLYGFEEEDFNNLTVVYEFENAQTGERYLNGATPKNAGSYYISVKLSGYDEYKYYVEYQTAKKLLVIEKATLSVSSISSSQKVYDKQAPMAPQIEYSGLLPADSATCRVVAAYFDGDGNEISVFNAGTYSIGAKVIDPSGADNYKVEYLCDTGTLVIEKITIYIAPLSKSEYYKGYDLRLSSSDFVILYQEHGGLVDGDKIYITPSTSLDPTKTYATVSISSVTVRDRYYADMTQNYNVYYSYNKDVMGSEYSASDFKGYLEYKIRTIYYEQIVPEGYGTFPYDGTVKYVGKAGDVLFRATQGENESERLFNTDEIRVSSNAIGPQVGQYYNWLKLSVYDTVNNRDVSRVYNLILTNANDSVVSIEVLNITVTIKDDLTDGLLEQSSTFYASERFEGRNALSTRYYQTDGLKTSLGHICEIIAIKSHGEWNLAVVLYEVKANGSLGDLTNSYNVTFIKGNGLNAQCRTVECHSLMSIQSDIVLTLFVGDNYLADLADGVGVENTYESRPALSSAQYKIEGLLPGHVANIAVVRSNGLVTLAILIVNGSSIKSFYYNLVCEGVNAETVLVSNIAEVKIDVLISVTADLNKIKAGEGLEKTFDGKWALKDDGSLYTAKGLLEGHTLQIVPNMSGGNVVFNVLIFEPRYTNGALSGRTVKSQFYNLVVVQSPAGAELVYSFSGIVPDLSIKFTENLYQKLANGEGIVKSSIDGRRILDTGMFEIGLNFGHNPLSDNHRVEIIVDGAGDGTFSLYIAVYQLSSGRRSDRSTLYNVMYESPHGNIDISVINTAQLGNEGLN